MKRFLASLRKLQWKLTFSYTLVTVGALLVAEILLLTGLILFLGSDILTLLMADGIRSEVIPAVQPFLAQDPPDQRGLQTWLMDLQQTTTQIRADGSTVTNSTLQIGSLNIDGGEQRLWVLDAEERLLGQVPPPADTAVFHQPFSTGTVPGADTLLAATRRGESASERLRREEKEYVLTAEPVFSAGNERLGTVLMMVQMPPIEISSVGPLLQALLITIVPLTLGAGTIGTLFGFLTARGFSRRLQTMSEAADSWSRGDFTVVATDPAGDEIGQLSRRLNRMAEQLQNLLATRQELAALEERNRLARDLHDSVKQQVFATAMQIGAAQALLEQDPAAARASLATAAGLARQAQQELTGLLQELRPAALEGKGLADALREFAADWSHRTEIEVDVQVQGKRPLPLPVEQTLFRIAQEALANVARHSRAETAVLSLIVDAAAITLTIEDDGQGFAPQQKRVTGVGLRSMEERMAQINGELDISTAPGKGTIVTAHIASVSEKFIQRDNHRQSDSTEP